MTQDLKAVWHQRVCDRAKELFDTHKYKELITQYGVRNHEDVMAYVLQVGAQLGQEFPDARINTCTHTALYGKFVGLGLIEITSKRGPRTTKKATKLIPFFVWSKWTPEAQMEAIDAGRTLEPNVGDGIPQNISSLVSEKCLNDCKTSRYKKDGRFKHHWNLSLNDANQLAIKQGGRCFFTGEKLQFGTGKNRTASLDRIDNARGYEPDNVQWVAGYVNSSRNGKTSEEFISMCQMVAQHHQKNNQTEDVCIGETNGE